MIIIVDVVEDAAACHLHLQQKINHYNHEVIPSLDCYNGGAVISFEGLAAEKGTRTGPRQHLAFIMSLHRCEHWTIQNE